MGLPSLVSVKRVERQTESGMEKWQGLMISLLGVSYILLQLFPSTEVQHGVSLLILFIMIWMVPKIRGSTFIISSILLAAAAAILLGYGAKLSDWMQAVRVNLTLVALFLFVPLFGIPVRTGEYVKSLQIVFTRWMDHPCYFFLSSKLLTHILGVVLNIGAVSIVYQLTQASSINSARLTSSAINRGFVTSIYWSPYFSAMALILSQLPVTWSSIVLYLIGLVLVSFLVSWGVEHSTIRSVHTSVQEGALEQYEEEEFNQAKRKVIELSVFLLLMMCIVLLLEMLTVYSMVFIICIVALVFPLLWCSLFGKLTTYREEFRQHVFITIPRMKREIVLFLIAGLFSGAFALADFGGPLMGMLYSVFGSFSMGLSFFLMLLVIVSSMAGVHPIVLITIFATSLHPQRLGVSPEYLAVLLLASWGISNTISPATAVNNLLANLLRVDLFDLSVRWNLKYVLIMLILIPIYLELVQL